jgi:hypothetical protein
VDRPNLLCSLMRGASTTEEAAATSRRSAGSRSGDHD